MSMTNTMSQVQWEYDRQMPPQLPYRDEMYFDELYDVRRDIRECRWKIENLIEKLDCLTEREREICGELASLGYENISVSRNQSLEVESFKRNDGEESMNNKKLGNDFESHFCEILSDNGFWTHNFAQNQAGQPADIIAARKGKSYLIDCKVCSNNRFAFSRIEDNQALAMRHWENCGNSAGWFAIILKDDDIYMIPHHVMVELEKVMSFLGEDEIRKIGVSLIDWMQSV